MDRELEPLTPKIGTGLKGYRVSFRDPHKPGRIVSARLGNSEDIARRHYIGHVGGEHWPFEFGANG